MKQSKAPLTSFAKRQALIFFLSCAGCFELSPFEVDLSEHERNQTRKNIELLQERPPPAGGFRFAVIADHHQEFEALEDVVQNLNRRSDLSFVAHLGDMTRLGLRHDYRLTLERLQQLHVPFVTTIGNHDAISNGKQVYREMFGPFDYTFDYGGVRFVCFNANRLEFSPDPPDLAWLDAWTRPTPGVEAVVALSHQASTQSGYFDILRDNGVLALITAHDHRLEIERLGELVLVSVDDVWSRHWSVVTIADGELTVESCTRQGCVVQTP